MKQYAIISHPLHSALVVSTNSHLFAEYMQLGYTIVFQGSKRECNEIFETEGSLCD